MLEAIHGHAARLHLSMMCLPRAWGSSAMMSSQLVSFTCMTSASRVAGRGPPEDGNACTNGEKMPVPATGVRQQNILYVIV